MAFSPLQSRVSNLPLVLAGPILRRATDRRVAVWLALSRQASNLRLDIYDGTATLGGGQLASTTALGERLHVGVIEAQAAATLSAGVVYEYNIFFGSEGGRDLDGPGILSPPSAGAGAIHSISYASRTRPSFVLPGDTPADLRFAQGSCRKPHGGKTDALAALDAILDATYDTPADRPQQLQRATVDGWITSGERANFSSSSRAH
jgi:hypothetical protein